MENGVGNNSVTKCELGQSYIGKEKDEKKKSLKVGTVLSITALNDIILLHTPSVSTTNIFHTFFCNVSQSYTFLDLY